MKTTKLFLLLFSIFFAVSLTQAQTSEVSSDIISAIKSGNANELSSYLNANVELVIDNKNDVFSKQQATGIIADFFRNKKVSNFQIIHQGNKEAASFAIGTLKTSAGNFRVYVLTRKSIIQQLRIEPSND